MGDLEGAGRQAVCLGIVCGMESEARALGHWRDDPRIRVRISAGRVDRAEEAVAELVAGGVTGLLSWGLCGGLDPTLGPGDVIECPPSQILTPDRALDTPDAKRRAGAAGYRIVDLESGPVARSGLPAHAIRVVLDEAGFALPAPALIPLGANGRPDLAGIARATIRHPGSVPAMVSLALRHASAMRALRQAAMRIGPLIKRLEIADT